VLQANAAGNCLSGCLSVFVFIVEHASSRHTTSITINRSRSNNGCCQGAGRSLGAGVCPVIGAICGQDWVEFQCKTKNITDIVIGGMCCRPNLYVTSKYNLPKRTDCLTGV